MSARGSATTGRHNVFRDVDAGSESERVAGIRALDRQAQFPAICRLRAWVLEELDPRPGMQALDVGCGTGEDARALALAVGPAGRAVGMDSSRVMVDVARRRAAAAGSAAHYVIGSADQLPADDGALDLVRSERVLQHLPDPAASVAEMFRVLRPGGRVALIDTDWRTLAIWPGSQEVTDAARHAWAGRFPHPAAGAQLLELVRDAGFSAPRQTAEVLLLRPGAVDEPPLGLVVDAVANAVPREALDSWRHQLAEAATRGTLTVAVTMFAVIAVRPGRDEVMA